MGAIKPGSSLVAQNFEIFTISADLASIGPGLATDPQWPIMQLTKVLGSLWDAVWERPSWWPDVLGICVTLGGVQKGENLNISLYVGQKLTIQNGSKTE